MRVMINTIFISGWSNPIMSSQWHTHMCTKSNVYVFFLIFCGNCEAQSFEQMIKPDLYWKVWVVFWSRNFLVIFLILVLSALMQHRCVLRFFTFPSNRKASLLQALRSAWWTKCFLLSLRTGLCGRTALGFKTSNKKGWEEGLVEGWRVYVVLCVCACMCASTHTHMHGNACGPWQEWSNHWVDANWQVDAS